MDEIVKGWNELVTSWVPKSANIGDYLQQEKPIRDNQLVALLSGLPEQAVFQNEYIPPGTIHFSGSLGSNPRTIRGSVPQYDLRKDFSLNAACAVTERYLSEKVNVFKERMDEAEHAIQNNERLLSEEQKRIAEANEDWNVEGRSASYYRGTQAKKERAESGAAHYEKQLSYGRQSFARFRDRYNSFSQAQTNHTEARASKNEQKIREALLGVMKLASKDLASKN